MDKIDQLIARGATQISRKYQMVGVLPEGKTGLQCLRETDPQAAKELEQRMGRILENQARNRFLSNQPIGSDAWWCSAKVNSTVGCSDVAVIPSQLGRASLNQQPTHPNDRTAPWPSGMLMAGLRAKQAPAR